MAYSIDLFTVQCRPAFSLFIMTILFFLSSCTQDIGDTESPVQKEAIHLTIVHEPELADYVNKAANAFDLKDARLDDGSQINVSSLEMSSVSAAQAIASGRIKPDAWLAPSGTIVDYTNHQVRNLGSKQVNCVRLFDTPVVAAIKPRHLGELNVRGHVFSWDEIAESQLRELRIAESQDRYISYSFGVPWKSSSGLASLAQLAHLSSYKRDEELTLETISSGYSREKLKQFQELVSQYGLNERDLLAQAAREEVRRLRFVLATEQQVIQHNLQNRSNPPSLIALYPKEGSYWQNYQLCSSQADWITPAKRAAIRKFSEFMLSPESQTEIQRLGFRPITQQAVAEPLTEEFGAKPSLPQRSFSRLLPEVTSHLLDNWTDIRRKSAVLLVIDLSGQMEDEALHTAKAEIRRFLSQQTEGNKVALVTFTNAPRLLSGFTEDTSSLISLIDSTEKIGGSAVRDSMKFVIDLMTGGELNDYQRSIVFLSDGRDDSSQMNTQFLIDIVSDRFSRHDISLSIVGTNSGVAEFSELKKISRAANGTFKAGTVSELPSILQEVFAGL